MTISKKKWTPEISTLSPTFYDISVSCNQILFFNVEMRKFSTFGTKWLILRQILIPTVFEEIIIIAQNCVKIDSFLGLRSG